MKNFSSLNRQIEEWRRKYRHFFPKISLPLSLRSPSSKLPGFSSSSARRPSKFNLIRSFNGINIPKRQKRFSSRKNNRRNSLVILVITIVSLTSVVGYRFYNQPQLAVGKMSTERIEAPQDGRFQDIITTEQKRREVRGGIVPILKQDRQVTAQIEQKLNTYLKEIEQLRNLAKPFPFVSEKILSHQVQEYIRTCKNSELEVLIHSALSEQNNNSSIADENKTYRNLKKTNLQFKQALQELKFYYRQNSQSDFESLVAKIAVIRYRYSQAYKEIIDRKINGLRQQDITSILNSDDRIWKKIKNSINTAAERILTQGIPMGLPSDLMRETVNVHLKSSVSSSNFRFAANSLLAILRPNLESDREATINMAQRAAEATEPVMVEIEEGETIVDKNEIITQEKFVLLDGFGLSRRSINWLGLTISGILVTGAAGIFWLVEKATYPRMRKRDKVLLCLLGVSAPLLSILHIPYTDLPAIGLLISSFYTPTLALTYISLLTGLVTFSAEKIYWAYLISGAAGGFLAAATAGRLRSRESMARLGMAVGLIQGGIYLIINLLASASAGTIWRVLVPESIVYGLSGVAWIVIALGISPYLERIFDVVTSIRLAELSNPNLPLLKRLATETPGTFQHTMFVATLAEAAARELNCNVELVRAGTLYHDIGKMHYPLAFIENQMGIPNIHDEISDPYKSAEIIKKHVSEGIVMARKYRLPKAVRDFIPEHQGTLSIAYFYHQAKQNAEREGDNIVLESDFRYDGPIPQSKETAIMMLADGCEAALRSLSKVTPQQALVTIKKIFKARWDDRQLEDSGLKYEELPLIAEVFVQVWQQCNHKRIVYPRSACETKRTSRI
jgi:putative nucleotidyltransferase with HDIG domain